MILGSRLGDSIRFELAEDPTWAHHGHQTQRDLLMFSARNVDRGVAVIPMGSLDSDPQHPPDAHIFVCSMAPWLTIADRLPQHEFHHRDAVENRGQDNEHGVAKTRVTDHQTERPK